MSVYKTISTPSEGYITEQRSKFLSFAFPVETAEEALTIVDTFRKKYYDARHVCWAYMLGEKREVFRVNDDGEPSSTAGKPILGVIQSNELTNILIIVVRYFGGVKLGTGGLIVAYRGAAQDAISNASIVEKVEETDITITFDYSIMDKVMRIVKDENAQVVSQQLNLQCTMVIRIVCDKKNQLEQRLINIQHGSKLIMD